MDSLNKPVKLTTFCVNWGVKESFQETYDGQYTTE